MNADPLRFMLQVLLRTDAGELVVAIPERGIALSMLSQPLEALGLEDAYSYRSVRVEAPAAWLWSTVDAAFLAGVIQRLDRDGHRVPLHGLPADLAKLLGLARRLPQARPSEPTARYSLSTRLGMRAFACAAQVREFVHLLGAVVFFVPRFIARRAWSQP